MKGWAVVLIKDDSGEHRTPCVVNNLYSQGAIPIIEYQAVYKNKSDAKVVRDGYRAWATSRNSSAVYEVVPAAVVCDIVKIKSFKLKEEFQR